MAQSELRTSGSSVKLLFVTAKGLKIPFTAYVYSTESLATHDLIGINSREDDCRIRKDKGAQNFAVFRHIALNLLQRERDHKRGLKARRKRAGWDRQYLMQVLMG